MRKTLVHTGCNNRIRIVHRHENAHAVPQLASLSFIEYFPIDHIARRFCVPGVEYMDAERRVSHQRIGEAENVFST